MKKIKKKAKKVKKAKKAKFQTQVRLTFQEREMLKVLGDGSMVKGLRLAMVKSGYRG